MKERVKVFTFLSGAGSTIIEPELEDHINEWLETVGGELLFATQSESERPGVGQHVTVCLFYVPDTPDEESKP